MDISIIANQRWKQQDVEENRNVAAWICLCLCLCLWNQIYSQPYIGAYIYSYYYCNNDHYSMKWSTCWANDLHSILKCTSKRLFPLHVSWVSGNQWERWELRADGWKMETKTTIKWHGDWNHMEMIANHQHQCYYNFIYIFQYIFIYLFAILFIVMIIFMSKINMFQCVYAILQYHCWCIFDMRRYSNDSIVHLYIVVGSTMRWSAMFFCSIILVSSFRSS